MKTPARALLLFLSLLLAPLARGAEGQPELVHLYQYKPLYFLVGAPYTKIELSFKAQIIEDLPVYFAYSQLMFWDIFTDQPFFHDINYDPEIFYRLPIESGESQKWLDIAPFEHESNGRGGDAQRSWNRSYLRFHTETVMADTLKLLWDLKLWAAWYTHANNTDIARYRGTWEVTVTAAEFLGPLFNHGDLALRLYPGGASNTNPLRGGQELTFRAMADIPKFLPFFIVQAFHGHGEELLDYREERWALRVGLGF